MSIHLQKPIGILGGTFDPVHNGHLHIALEIQQQFNLAEIRFIPCQQPVLDKIAQASSQDRLAMLKLAIENQPKFTIDDRELTRTTPSYTVETLQSLHHEMRNTPLCLIIGSDALEGLNRWHNWQALITLAHIIVVPRSDHYLSQTGVMAEFIKKHKTDDKTLLIKQLAGGLFIADTNLIDISATEIRAQIAKKLNPLQLLPDKVRHYIQQRNLYD